MAADVSRKQLLAQGSALGVVVASAVLVVLLARWQTPGVATLPALSSARFSVAVLAGPKQAAQSAPANADTVAEVVAPASAQAQAVVTAQRPSSLPQAVQAAQQADPGTEIAQPVEVIPPAQVSMPGGQLMANDAPVGDAMLDPFEIKPRQVYIRLLVNEQGQVVKFGIVRSGGDPMRDSLILKAMRSRTYDTKELRLQVQDKVWQLDLVLDYGTNDFLP